MSDKPINNNIVQVRYQMCRDPTKNSGSKDKRRERKIGTESCIFGAC